MTSFRTILWFLLLVMAAAFSSPTAHAQGVQGLYTGNGSLSVTTSSAAINTMTVSATGAKIPVSWSNLIVWVPGSGSNVAVCPRGGTCTCPQNTIAPTNGDTILASGGSWTYLLPGITASVPTIVACTTTTTVEFQW
jgi:hypothetical protein